MLQGGDDSVGMFDEQSYRAFHELFERYLSLSSESTPPWCIVYVRRLDRGFQKLIGG